MRPIFAVVLIVAGAAAAQAGADVLDAGPGGFSLVHEVTIGAARADVWKAAVENVGSWWSSDHTISGDAKNMSIDPVPQGCFCESIGSLRS